MGSVADALRGFDQGVFRGLVLAQLEVGPAQRIEIGAIGGIEIDCLLDHAESFIQLDPAVGQHVTEIVERGGVLRITHENFAEHLFRLIVFLLTLVG